METVIINIALTSLIISTLFVALRVFFVYFYKRDYNDYVDYQCNSIKDDLIIDYDLVCDEPVKSKKVPSTKNKSKKPAKKQPTIKQAAVLAAEDAKKKAKKSTKTKEVAPTKKKAVRKKKEI